MPESRVKAYLPPGIGDNRLLIDGTDGNQRPLDPDIPDGLAIIGPYWTRATWSNGKYNDISWLGHRMKQLPEDIVMLQEVFWEVRPHVVVETGVADGGSSVFWASLLAVSGGREVVAIDITIPESVREAIAAHPLAGLIHLVEGDSVDTSVIHAARARVRADDRVMVVLDSNHTEAHVLGELDAYASLVTAGSYIVVTDGVMQVLSDAPKGRPEWEGDNPLTAIERWLPQHAEFVRDLHREHLGATYFPGGWLRRVGDPPATEDPATPWGEPLQHLHQGREEWRVNAFETERRRQQAEAERDGAMGIASALLDSTSWRVGHALVGPLGKALRRLRGQPAAVDPRDRLIRENPERLELTNLARRHLDLLKRSLTDSLRGDPYRPYAPDRGTEADDAWVRLRGLLDRGDVELVRRVGYDPERRAVGGDWPFLGETMVGMARLDNLQDCVEAVHLAGVPGDLVETGVWRGGACILMRAVLAELGDRSRQVWACDSFEGLPPPDEATYPADTGDRHWRRGELAVSLAEVKQNFARYGLLDDQVRFAKGWFEDTLSQLPTETIAVLRLDGDMYGSTMVALESLEPKVPPGGFVVVDDYGAIPACRLAVDDYRRDQGIDDPIEPVDWTGVFWRKRRTR